VKECCVETYQLLTVMSFFSSCDVCVCVGGIGSQPFTLCVGPRQGFVMPPLLFIVLYMNWADSNSRVNDGVTVGSSGVNNVLIVDDLLLLACCILKPGSLTCTWSVFSCVKPSRIEYQRHKSTEVLCLSRTPSQCTQQACGNTL